MFRRSFLCVVAFVSLGLLMWSAHAQPSASMNWIWFDEGDPLSGAPAESRFFRRVVSVEGDVTQASVEITADNHYTLWVNGAKVGSGDSWASLDKHNIAKHLVKGKNAVAVEARNEGGPAGLVARLTYTTKGKGKQAVASDASWKASMSAPAGWQKVDFDDAKWSKSKVLGAYGKVGPWGGVAGSKGGPPVRKFTVPEGYRVEEAVKLPEDRGNFSLVNMTFDDKGRLLVSQEGGGTLLCTRPDAKGVLQEVRDYCTQVKNAHGMCWVKDALYLVGDGPKGTGLYRCRDTKKADKIDEVTLIHRFEGGMGEHGPHAVIHGPDDKLYVVVGNHAFARIGPKQAPNPEKLAPNSPLLRWPTGGQGPDQGKPGSTEDVLLPRLDDANGHAAGMRAPGGTIWRMDHDGKNVSLVAAGFRNQFDAAFSPDGELFSFDSDMEWDEGLPWYRAVRAIHCPPGADFVWRTGAANTPNYYLDSLPPLVETGRGSPVGVTFCHGGQFGAKYQGAFFMADWSIGVIYAVLLNRKGATYEGKAEKFCVGSPMPVSDVEFGPDGAMWFTVGGRGSQGGVYRVVHTAPLEAPLGFTVAQSVARLRDVKDVELLTRIAADKEPEIRAMALWRLAVVERAGKELLVKLLGDTDALVRRRACEALIRAGIEPDVIALWPLLSDKDHFVCTAARLVLQRIDPAKWVAKLADEKSDLAASHAIIALCHAGKADAHADAIFVRLKASEPKDVKGLLDYARTVQLACFHIAKPQAASKDIAATCEKLFPHTDASVNRELAILLTHFRRTRVIDTPVQEKLLKAIEASKGDRPQQIHYFYCLRLLHDGWTKEQKSALAAWYESTRDWRGGASFSGFLSNIFLGCLGAFDESDRTSLIENGEKMPLVALAVLRRQQTERKPTMLPALKTLGAKMEKSSAPRAADVRRAVEEAILLTVSEHPRSEDYADLLKGLSSSSKTAVFNAVSALKKIDAKPKPDDARAYRAALEAAKKLDGNRWKAVELLRHWSGDRQFGYEQKEAAKELAAWGKWFGQAFPKEPALIDADADAAGPSKYKYDELLAYLTTGQGKTGSVAKGKQAFEKGQCLKCHKFGKDGEGLGPDLSAVSKRFKRGDLLETMYYPSKVISDQYRSTSIVTTKGQRLEGLVALQGDNVTVLQNDGTKVTLRKKDIEQQFASLVSVMPEKLLDLLSKEEIADLFAFLESEPAK